MCRGIISHPRPVAPFSFFLLYQTSSNGRRILQEWWNYYLPSKNLADFMEQVTYYSLAD